MKKEYKKPEMIIEKFVSEDIITTSVTLGWEKSDTDTKIFYY